MFVTAFFWKLFTLSFFLMIDYTKWIHWIRSSECEREFPAPILSRTSSFQRLLIVQVFRPDRLFSAQTQFVLDCLVCSRIISYHDETSDVYKIGRWTGFETGISLFPLF